MATMVTEQTMVEYNKTFSDALMDRTLHFVQLAAAKGVQLATLESCTAGLLAATITAVAGVSTVFRGGLVVYDNCWKQQLLGVKKETLDSHGAVSAEVACEMAMGLFATNPNRGEFDSVVTHAIAITGLAGNDSHYSLEDKNNPHPNPEKAAGKKDGLVFIAVAARGGGVRVARYQFVGDRHTIRHQTVVAAMDLAELYWQEEKK